MANFYTLDFVFDNKPSRLYDLHIVDLDEKGIFSGVGSADVDIITQRVLRKSRVYYLGRTQEPVLEFPLTFASPEAISGIERNLIQAWLFGRAGYKKLQILQDDLNGAYFNCFLTKPETKYIGNFNYAFECKVECDSPYAYYPKSFTRTFNPQDQMTYPFEIYNTPSEDDYLYPNLSFTLANIGSSFSLKNLTDNNREFLFAGLLPFETMTVNNDLQMVTSSTGLYRLSNFNKRWFRLLPGINRLVMQGAVTSFNITYNHRVKIGA